MDCRTFQKNVETYLQGGLDFTGRFSIERHAQQCFICGKELTEAQTLGQKARELSRVCAPPNFEGAVLNRIHKENGRSRFWNMKRFWVYGFEWPSPLMMAAGVMSLAFLGLGALYSVGWLTRGDPSSSRFLATGEPAATPQMQGNAGLGTFPPAGQEAASFEAKPATAVPAASSLSRTSSIADENWAEIQAEPVDSEFMEYRVPGPGDRQLIMRLPKTIRMKSGQPSEEYFIRNVSH